ncbi:MAG TPA: GNAT family N-acetyltransferase [Chthonomonadales bacterium]|nr:GNAT family N-acetyltransferase [Chthonomonadales bacterium]
MRYETGAAVGADQLIDLYRACSLGARRPVDDRATVELMLAHANLLVTAWDGGLLVGAARTLTDFGYVAYLADLAVRESHQRRGIGRELVRRTRDALAPRATLVLLAAPAAEEYYPLLGFQRHPSAWILGPGDRLR